MSGARARLAAGAVILALSARSARADGLPSFPIGLFGVDRPELLAELRRSGFDSFYTDRSSREHLEALAREARRQKMTLLAFPDQVRGNVDAKELKAWPAVWYLFDEPDVARLEPAALARLSRQTREWDPGHPQTLVIGQGSAADAYGNVGDALMLDWYPVPHLRLDSVADQVDAARRSLPADKPLWMVLQAFDWRNYPQRNPNAPRVGRFPTRAEMRFMSYLAVLRGAAGLFYFKLTLPGGGTLLDRPEEWQALASVADELSRMRPAFLSTRVEPPFRPEAGGPEAAAWRKGSRTYVVLLNRHPDRLAPVPAELLERRWRPLFEFRREARDCLTAKDARSWLEPGQVLVLERSRWPWSR